MDIVVAHNFYKQRGGEDACVAAEIALLRNYGHKVTEYFSHNDTIDSRSRIDVALQAMWNGSVYDELRQLFRAHRPQLVHFHNTFPLISPAAYYAARDEGVCVIQTLHNYRLLCPNALLLRDGRVCESCIGKSIAWPSVVHACYQGSRAASMTVAAMLAAHRMLGTWDSAVGTYIALNSFSRAKLIAGGLPARKIMVKPNFVSPDPQAGAGEGGYFLFAGRLSEEKGVELLLEAWSRLSDLPLKIAGSGPLEERVRTAAAQNCAIEWVGSASSERIYNLLGNAKALIAPSIWYENFPRVVVEAFAKGTPVIAPNLGAFPEIVEDGVTGLLFEPYDACKLADVVRKAAADPLVLKRLRRGARAGFEKSLTAETNYHLLLSIYQQALGEKREIVRPRPL